jgi:hypothetical protein
MTEPALYFSISGNLYCLVVFLLPFLLHAGSSTGDIEHGVWKVNGRLAASAIPIGYPSRMENSIEGAFPVWIEAPCSIVIKYILIY